MEFSLAEKIRIYKAMALMCPNPNLGSFSQVLKSLVVYYEMADFIAQEIDAGFIVETAEEILMFYKLDNKYQLKWRKDTDSIAEAVLSRHPKLKQKVDYHKEQKKIFCKFNETIDRKQNIIKQNTSALLTLAELPGKQKEVREVFFDICNEIQNSLLETQMKLFLFNTLLPKAEKSCLEFTELQAKAKPVEVLYYKSGNRVTTKVALNRSTYKYTVGRGQEIRINRGNDCGKYPIIVAATYIEGFLYCNDIRNIDVFVNPDSVECYYQYGNKVSATLSPLFVSEWWNYDCPNIYRHTPNKDRSTNMLGIVIPHFSTCLVESSWQAAYIAKDITEQEAQQLCKGHENTMIAKTIDSVLEARKLRDIEIQELSKYIENYDARIQSIVNQHTEEILLALTKEYNDRVTYQKVVGGQDKLVINDNFGFDCGWINVYTTDSNYTDKKNLLRQVKQLHPAIPLNFPYTSQSVTLQKTQFQLIKEIVFRETGTTLISEIIWD